MSGMVCPGASPYTQSAEVILNKASCGTARKLVYPGPRRIVNVVVISASKPNCSRRSIKLHANSHTVGFSATTLGFAARTATCIRIPHASRITRPWSMVFQLASRDRVVCPIGPVEERSAKSDLFKVAHFRASRPLNRNARSYRRRR
jgi:hypothetical protein